MGNFWSRVCIEILNPAVLAPHRLSLSLVTFPPLAVTPQVSTNLGPVARLDCGEGQTRVRAFLANGRACSFRLQSRLHHDVQEAIAGKNSRSNKHPTPHPLTNGQLFSLGSRVCIGILNPAVLAPHRLSLSLVTYPPLAVTPQVSTNLGPVARLEQIYSILHRKFADKEIA
jgi:hypothetical protein